MTTSDETLLHRYHADPEKPTIALWDRWQDSHGRSTYQVLVDAASALPRDGRVLDLGCGEGYLLDLLARAGFRNLTGVDLSEEELERARTRLDPGIELKLEDASAMSYASASFDALLCHLALMLMSPVEPILAESARVLRPGGSFLAVINRYVLDPAFEIYRRELHRVTIEMGLERMQLGDPRMFHVEGITELLGGQAFDVASLRIHDFEVGSYGTPAQLWAMLRWMYDVFRLPERGQTRLYQALTDKFRPLLDHDGKLRVTLGMRLVACRTP